VKAASIALYQLGTTGRESRYDPSRYKFEFGTDAAGRLFLIDEVLTPRLFALLAGRELRAQPVAAELRQAVRARPSAGHQVGAEAAGAAPARRNHPAHAEKYLAALRNLLGEDPSSASEIRIL